MSVQTRTNKMKNIKGPGLTTRIGLNHLLAEVSVKKRRKKIALKLKPTCDTIAMLRIVEMYKDDTLISITKAAQILNVHPETLRRWDKSNKLQATRIGSRGHRKYSMSKIQALLEKPTNKEDIKPLRQFPLSPDMLGSFHEVDGFPVSNIPVGATFTFTPQTARNVTDWTHGLHVYPAKFIPQIPRWAFEFSRLRHKDVVLDPFCGCGTTLVEALVRGFNSYGVDVNPLACLLTQAKTTPLYTNDLPKLLADVQSLLAQIRNDEFELDLDKPPVQLNLHSNWQFWFPPKVMENLIRIKRSIDNFKPDNADDISETEINAIRNFYRACFSSIVKKCSYFDEHEIKVRKDGTKNETNLPDPALVLKETIEQNLVGLIQLSKRIDEMGSPIAKIIGGKAQRISLPNDSVDLVVTSPPYLNAIDYPMAHKYSLFLLDLTSPHAFKDHCREYIGVTERAVRKQEYDNIRYTGNTRVDSVITKLSASSSTVDRIRAYIISEYFIDMRQALLECYRVLKTGSCLIIIIGDNVIRKDYFPTSEFIQEIAVSSNVGFELITFFFHQLRNIRLKKTRGITGGLIKKERIMVLRKPNDIR